MEVWPHLKQAAMASVPLLINGVSGDSAPWWCQTPLMSSTVIRNVVQAQSLAQDSMGKDWVQGLMY